MSTLSSGWVTSQDPTRPFSARSVTMPASTANASVTAAAAAKKSWSEWSDEVEDIAFLRDSLAKTGSVSTQLMTTLQSLDGRQVPCSSANDASASVLVRLESSVLPLHHATQTLSKLYDNMDKTLVQLRAVLSHFDLCSTAVVTTSAVSSPANATGYAPTHDAELDRLLRAVHAVPNSVQELAALMAHLDRIRDSWSFLRNCRMKQSDKLLAAGKRLLRLGLLQLEQLMRQQLISLVNSAPTTIPEDTDPATLITVPATLVSITNYLALYESDSDFHGTAPPETSYTKVITELRSDHLIRQLATHSQAVAHWWASQHGAKDSVVVHYVHGSSPFLPYTRALCRLLATEWSLLYALIPTTSSGAGSITSSRSSRKHHMNVAFENVTGPALVKYKEAADAILSKVKRASSAPTSSSTAARDSSSIFLTLDVLDTLIEVLFEAKYRDRWITALQLAGKHSGDLNYLLSEFALASCKLFPDFLEDIKQSGTGSKSGHLPEDGTVHELTSNTLTWLKRLVDYDQVVEPLFMLAAQSLSKDRPATDGSSVACPQWSWDGLHFSAAESRAKLSEARQRFLETLNRDDRSEPDADCHVLMRKYYADVIESLLTNLEAKAKSYKKMGVASAAAASIAGDQPQKAKPILATLFLLNNCHYVSKTIRSHPALYRIVGEHLEGMVDKRMRDELGVYMQSWQPLLSILMDTTHGLKMTAGKPAELSKNDKSAIKEKFRKFNDEFEDCFKQQKKYAIPDSDLRGQVLKDIKQIVMPMYTRFLERYQKVPFTNNPQKYLKYDMNMLDMMLNKFFDPSSQ